MRSRANLDAYVLEIRAAGGRAVAIPAAGFLPEIDMEFWQGCLFAAAAFLALRSLAMLMTHHRQRYRRQLLLEEQQKRPRKPRRT